MLLLQHENERIMLLYHRENVHYNIIGYYKQLKTTVYYYCDSYVGKTLQLSSDFNTLSIAYLTPALFRCYNSITRQKSHQPMKKR